MPALDVESISFSYKHINALSSVSLSVETGSFVALLGANGAGKTTLFSIISGLYRAQSGSVSIMGHSFESDTLRALASIGVVFQKSTLDMDLTVMQNLRYATDLQGMSQISRNRSIERSVELHQMQPYISRKVGALSGGQRRRVELARALLHEPALLLLDEPTVGLDLGSRQDFVAHVKSLCQSQQTGVLWATHLMDEVTLDDEVYLLNSGQVIADGKVSTLLSRFKQDSVADLFNELNRVHNADNSSKGISNKEISSNGENA